MASIVHEDSNILVFMDLNPANIGHTLIVPRKHWENIYDIPDNILTELIVMVKRISVAVKKAVGAEGISVLQLNGEAAGQTVMHLHIHIIPRFDGDHISRALSAMIIHQDFKKSKRNELDVIARKIKENL